MTSIVYLFLAIAAEVTATTALKACDGFTRLLPSLVVIAGYALAFVSLSYSLRGIPIGVAYATWAGVGTVSMAVLGWVVYEEPLNLPVIGGMTLVIAGVGLISFYSNAH